MKLTPPDLDVCARIDGSTTRIDGLATALLLGMTVLCILLSLLLSVCLSAVCLLSVCLSAVCLLCVCLLSVCLCSLPSCS